MKEVRRLMKMKMICTDDTPGKLDDISVVAAQCRRRDG